MSKPIIRNPDGNIWFILGAAANALKHRPQSLKRFNDRTSAAMRDGKTDYNGMLRIVMEFVEIHIDEPEEEDDNLEGDDDLGLEPEVPKEKSDSDKMIEIISATSITQGIPRQVHRRWIDLGQIVLTEGAKDCLSPDVMTALLTVHSAGCWGNGLDAEDEAVNEDALPPHDKTLSVDVQPAPKPNTTKVREGHRLLGCWRLGVCDAYIITEAGTPTDEPVTTIMLTHEY
jgi:hypothetical protein